MSKHYAIDEERLKDPTFSAYLNYKISDIPLKHLPMDLKNSFLALEEKSSNYKKKLEEDFDYIYNENAKLLKKIDEKLEKLGEKPPPFEIKREKFDILPSQRYNSQPPKKPKKKNSFVHPDEFNTRLFEHFPFRSGTTGLSQLKKILDSRTHE